MDQQAHTLHVKGMHCKACIFLIQDTVTEIDGVNHVKVSLRRQTVEIIHSNENMTPEELSGILNPLLHPHGYSIHTEPQTISKNRGEYVLAVIMAAALIYGFVELQKLGLLQMLNAENRTYGTSFIIGLIASVSSCLAVVG